MQLVKKFGLEMIENEKLFFQFQIEFTSSSFKTDVLITLENNSFYLVNSWYWFQTQLQVNVRQRSEQKH